METNLDIYMYIYIYIYIYTYTRVAMCMQFRKPACLQGRLGSQEDCLALATSLVCLTIERDIIRWPARSRNRCENRHAHRSQIVLEQLRGTQNRLKIDPGAFLGRPVVPKSMRKASRERLGSVSGRRRRGPGSPRVSTKATWDARSGA